MRKLGFARKGGGHVGLRGCGALKEHHLIFDLIVIFWEGWCRITRLRR